jgi:hypothetical protein
MWETSCYEPSEALSSHVQAMAASWDSLCPEMREQVFAALSLLDLGRAAPTCRDFRAAYTARLSAAHPAAVDAGVSFFGEGFLRAHSRLLSRFSRGLDVFSGCDFSARSVQDFHILGDGTVQVHRDLTGVSGRPASVVNQYGAYCKRLGVRPHLFDVGPPGYGDPCPYFGQACHSEGGHLHIRLACEPEHCAQAARGVCGSMRVHAG